MDCTHQAALPPVCVAGGDLPCALQHTKRANSKRAFTGPLTSINDRKQKYTGGRASLKRRVFKRCPSTHAFLDAVVTWRRVMVTIAASRDWTLRTLRWLSWTSHAPIAEKLFFLKKGGVHISLPETTPVACPPSPTSTLGQRGVYRDSASGAVGCDAIVSKYRCHLVWKSVAPHLGL